eukprot:gene7451-5249_t
MEAQSAEHTTIAEMTKTKTKRILERGVRERQRTRRNIQQQPCVIEEERVQILNFEKYMYNIYIYIYMY